jgi:predicted DsbA family dithiol-disulfide isomerase
VLTRLAGEVGLDVHEYRQALQMRRYRQAHQAALRHTHEEMGITAVPTFIIGGTTLTGLQNKETLELVIEEELAREQADGGPGIDSQSTQ